MASVSGFTSVQVIYLYNVSWPILTVYGVYNVCDWYVPCSGSWWADRLKHSSVICRSYAFSSRPKYLPKNDNTDIITGVHEGRYRRDFYPSTSNNLLTPTVAIWVQHPVPDRVKLSFVIFDIRALWRSALSKIRPTNDGLTRSGRVCFIAVYPYGNSGRRCYKVV